MLTHVVLFKFKDDPADVPTARLEAALKGLPAQIGEIRAFRVGRDIVRSERSYDLALISVFDDLAAMQRYQVHPEHLKVVALVRELCAGVVAVDFNE